MIEMARRQTYPIVLRVRLERHSAARIAGLQLPRSGCSLLRSASGSKLSRSGCGAPSPRELVDDRQVGGGVLGEPFGIDPERVETGTVDRAGVAVVGAERACAGGSGPAEIGGARLVALSA